MFVCNVGGNSIQENLEGCDNTLVSRVFASCGLVFVTALCFSEVQLGTMHNNQGKHAGLPTRLVTISSLFQARDSKAPSYSFKSDV